jgi:hypothetical protein
MSHTKFSLYFSGIYRIKKIEMQKSKEKKFKFAKIYLFFSKKIHL